MAAIDDLISQISDESLRERIRAEIKRANKQKKFGLVYEEHLPESTPLYDVPVKKGSIVAKKNGEITDLLYVESITDGQATCISKATKERAVYPVSTLVSVAQFGEPIYPYLKPVDTVCNAPDSDLWHTLIEADNYHALQLLAYLYAGKVDCIYIDPPYNTGARDWKYNNDYVDGADTYRHSKWLSMIEKRLKLAKQLLNPRDSILIVTIDEKEYLHLGCLLEELFSDARIQMVSSVINASGSKRLNAFSRTDEYIFFVMIGESIPLPLGKEQSENSEIHWRSLRRGDLESMRGTSKGGTAQFYPIYVNRSTNRIEHIGDPLPPECDRHNAPQLVDCVAVFPIRDNGTEMNWGVRPETARNLLKKGYLRVGGTFREKPQEYNVQYLTSGSIEDIETGKAVLDGYASDGSVMAHYENGKPIMPKTAWAFPAHDATQYGTNLISSILTDKRFSYPKSLYAVKDCMKLFIADNPTALVIDFFAGSGTTLHAINLLNAEDNGRRQCIMVTNNEVSADEAKYLSDSGHQPGDPEWEELGIARYVTWPRTVCSIEGHDINGQPLKGNYLGGDPENPRAMADGFAANAAFFKLGFLDKTAVALGRQFKELLPVLWLKAGAHGPCPTIDFIETPAMLVLPENHFAVLTDEAQFETFAAQVNPEDRVDTIYIVTDSEAGYREMISGLKAENTYQLYRDYLDNFRINQGGR